MLIYADVCVFLQRVRHKLSKTFDDNGYLLWQVANVASMRVLITLYMFPHASLYVPSYLHISVLMCVLMPLYKCPRFMHVLIPPYMCP